MTLVSPQPIGGVVGKISRCREHEVGRTGTAPINLSGITKVVYINLEEMDRTLVLSCIAAVSTVAMYGTGL